MNLFWKISSKLYKVGCPIARLFEIISFIVGSNAISAKANIGKGTIFHHSGCGCVVHDKAVIGENCHIFQNVTIGSKWPKGENDGSCPKIGDNVFIGAGAVLIGNITIGNNVIIGANAVVDCNVDDGMIFIGIQNRGIRKNENP